MSEKITLKKNLPPKNKSQLPIKLKNKDPKGSKSQNPSVKNAICSGLYIVSTPIGNAQDFSHRALDTIKNVNMVICEDTRITKKLFSIHKVSNQLITYRDDNAQRVRPFIISLLKKGQSLALISDAGTPLISDPGYKLVQMCIEEKIMVTAVPGASSILTALVLSGLPSDKFFFYGFLPNKSLRRKSVLKALKTIPGTLIFFESSKRLIASLTDIYSVIGDRNVSIARELTKLFEDIRRGNIKDIINWYKKSGAPKGEITILVGPAKHPLLIDLATLDKKIKQTLISNSTKEAADLISKETKLSKQKVYSRILFIKKLQPKTK